MNKRNKYSIAMIQVDNDSKADFMELKKDFGLSSAETLKSLCKFFKDNYDYVITTKNEFESTLRGEIDDKTKAI